MKTGRSFDFTGFLECWYHHLKCSFGRVRTHQPIRLQTKSITNTIQRNWIALLLPRELYSFSSRTRYLNSSHKRQIYSNEPISSIHLMALNDVAIYTLLSPKIILHKIQGNLIFQLSPDKSHTEIGEHGETWSWHFPGTNSGTWWKQILASSSSRTWGQDSFPFNHVGRQAGSKLFDSVSLTVLPLTRPRYPSYSEYR